MRTYKVYSTRSKAVSYTSYEYLVNLVLRAEAEPYKDGVRLNYDSGTRKKFKREILERDNFICYICGNKEEKMTIDHIIPKRQNGPMLEFNLKCCCLKCNEAKGAMDLHDFLKNIFDSDSSDLSNGTVEYHGLIQLADNVRTQFEIIYEQRKAVVERLNSHLKVYSNINMEDE